MVKITDIRITGGKRDPELFHAVTLLSRYRNGQKLAQLGHNALHCLRQAGEVVERVERDGVRLNGDRTADLPFIYVRNLRSQRREPWKLFVSHSDVSELAATFGLQAETVNGAFFLLNAARSDINRMRISPSWPEMVQLNYRRQVCELNRDPRLAPLPDPPETCYGPLSEQFFALPGLPALYKIDPALRMLADGRLVFDRDRGWPRAQYFHKGRLLLTMHFDGKMAQLRGEFRGKPADPSFDRVKKISYQYKGLFGLEPKIDHLVLTLTAGEDGITLPAVNLVKVKIRPAVFGQTYWLALRRQGEKISIRCYHDEKRQALHGYCELPLIGGQPFQNYIYLNMFRRAAE